MGLVSHLSRRESRGPSIRQLSPPKVEEDGAPCQRGILPGLLQFLGSLGCCLACLFSFWVCCCLLSLGDPLSFVSSHFGGLSCYRFLKLSAHIRVRRLVIILHFLRVVSSPEQPRAGQPITQGTPGRIADNLGSAQGRIADNPGPCSARLLSPLLNNPGQDSR